ncbi:hypothetical protein Sant_3716 [Sodalis praecaptivus]|uniref:Uncharacterized protein n=1 Tax=Sodalis praecaptivus TaxID=1239307 RepID=W0HXU8_9GAMM|nr:hypothetical protein [Sodalis praecaptivus]AHF78696.1 hypothetical protein Sant_3716 [Sodalis praecaptivus]
MSIDRSPEKEENACPRWRGSKRWGVKATGYFALSALSGWCLWCEHARGETFWLSCLLVAAVIAGIFYALSRIGGRCDTLYFATQDCERAQRLRDEIERGQRYGRLVARCATTCLDRDGQRLAAGILPPVGRFQSEILACSGVTPTRDQIQAMTPPRWLAGHFTWLAQQLGPALNALPPSMPCYLVMQCDSGLPVEEEQQLLLQTGAPFNRHFTPLSASGLLALDDWLDDTARAPSALVVIAVQRAVPPEDALEEKGALPGAEGIIESTVGLVMISEYCPSLPVLARIHRPQPEPASACSRALSRALLWARLEPKAVRHAWLTGNGAVAAATEQALRLAPQTLIHHLDDVLGPAGMATPWLSLAAAAEQCREDGAAQLIICHEAARRIWIGGVTPPEP